MTCGTIMKMIHIQLPVPSRENLEKEYLETVEGFERALYEFNRRLSKYLNRLGIRTTIKQRVKRFESYYQKILRISRETDGVLFIGDLFGIRIVCPFLEDLETVEQLLFEHFDIQEREEKGSEFSFQEFGYDSLHFIAAFPRDIADSFHLNDDLVVEVQLRTILQDAWAEVEHELVYKAEVTPFAANLRRKLAALNASLSLSDIIFHEIRVQQRELQYQIDTCRSAFLSMIEDGRNNEQEGELERIKSKFPSQAQENQFLKALTLHNAQRYESAIDLYTEIMKEPDSQPICALVHLHRGMAFFALNENREAMKDFSAALELDPHNEDARKFHQKLNHPELNYQELNYVEE